jgi:hypothetical protein
LTLPLGGDLMVPLWSKKRVSGGASAP